MIHVLESYIVVVSVSVVRLIWVNCTIHNWIRWRLFLLRLLRSSIIVSILTSGGVFISLFGIWILSNGIARMSFIVKYTDMSLSVGVFAPCRGPTVGNDMLCYVFLIRLRSRDETISRRWLYSVSCTPKLQYSILCVIGAFLNTTKKPRITQSIAM